MTEQTQVPEGIVSDFFDGVIQKVILSQITSRNVKAIFMGVLDNADELAKASENKIDDYMVALARTEFDANWDMLYSYIATRLGLIAIPQGIGSDEVRYTTGGEMIPENEVLMPETVTPEVSVEVILMIVNLVLPYIVKWFGK